MAFCLDVFLLYFTTTLSLSAAETVPLTWNIAGNYFESSNKPLFVKPGDTIQIICPRFENSNGNLGRQLYENVWHVGYAGYINCDATNGTRVALCSNPEQIEKINLALVPRLGETIYLISTSNGERTSLKNLKGGHCETVDMKLLIYVQPDSVEQ